MSKNQTRFVFFGTSEFSVNVLNALEDKNFTPSLVITTPDQPQGRKLQLTSPPVKTWAETRHIPTLQPSNLKDQELVNVLQDFPYFILASYGKILPGSILEIPAHGTLNVHPSLLPKLRGASPIESALLKEKETGVSIMLMDEKMDHGPVLASIKLEEEYFPASQSVLSKTLATLGGELLAELIPKWLAGKIQTQPQNHAEATFTKKLEKKDAEINFEESPEKNYRKILAYERYNPFFFYEKNNKQIRIIIKKAKLTDGELCLERVLPEGRKEMTWEEFQKWRSA